MYPLYKHQVGLKENSNFIEIDRNKTLIDLFCMLSSFLFHSEEHFQTI